VPSVHLPRLPSKSPGRRRTRHLRYLYRGNGWSYQRLQLVASIHHAPGELGAAGLGVGGAVGAGDEPWADGRGVGQGAGDRAAAGGDDGDVARPPRVRVRALAH
jgi:hypothetical protein